MLVLEMLVMDLSPVHQLRLPGCVTDEVCDFGQVTPVSQASVSPAEDESWLRGSPQALQLRAANLRSF